MSLQHNATLLTSAVRSAQAIPDVNFSPGLRALRTQQLPMLENQPPNPNTTCDAVMAKVFDTAWHCCPNTAHTTFADHSLHDASQALHAVGKSCTHRTYPLCCLANCSKSSTCSCILSQGPTLLPCRWDTPRRMRQDCRHC